MAKVVLRDGESFDSLLKRFRERVQSAQILSDVREKRFFTPPCERRQLALRRARRRERRRQRKVTERGLF